MYDEPLSYYDTICMMNKNLAIWRNYVGKLFLVFTHVTSALTTVAIRHVGAQTNALNREITVRK